MKAGRAALQWRLLLLWNLAMLVPTAIVALPVWTRLGGLLDHSVHSEEWARQFDALAMSDVLSQTGNIAGLGVISVAVTLLLSPLLTGMAATAVRTPRSPGFGELLSGGAREYWPMLRLQLWSLLPYGVAAVAGVVAFAIAYAFSEKAILESQADDALLASACVLIALLVLAHALVESGRAQLTADPDLRSAMRALWRGTCLSLRRPFATFGLYAGTSLVGYAMALLLGMLRIRTLAVGEGGFWLAMALTQSITVVLAWQRVARLAGLTGLVRATPPPLDSQPSADP